MAITAATATCRCTYATDDLSGRRVQGGHPLLLCARLRTSDQDGAAGSVTELSRMVKQLRRRWPNTRIRIRGDSGFCREDLMSWCEREGIGYVLGLARNTRLAEQVEEAMERARKAHRHTKRAARRFVEFTYRTRESWSRERRVVGKAEYLPKGPNPRFVVTNLPRSQVRPCLYERLYCARGEMENRIKEQQPACSPTAPAPTIKANQLRL